MFKPPAANTVTVLAAGTVVTVPATSQSPAVSDMLATLADVLDVSPVPDVALVRSSPTLPAFALLFVVVPTIPFVWLGVIVPVATIVVAAIVFGVVAPRVPFSAPPLELTAAGAVPPIAGGLAR